MQQRLHHRLPEEWRTGQSPRYDRSDHLQGVSVPGRRHTGRQRVLDSGDVRRCHHHAGARPQGGPERDGEGRPAHHAHRSAHHTGHAHARAADPLGGRRAQVLAQALHQAAPTQHDLSECQQPVLAAAAHRRLLVQLGSGLVHAHHLRRPHSAHHRHHLRQASLSASQL